MDLPFSSNHLYSTILENPADPEPYLVFADWLEEQTEPVWATGYRLLGGVCADEAGALERELALVCVAAASWLGVREKGTDWFYDVGEKAIEASRVAADKGSWSASDKQGLLDAVHAARARSSANDFHRLVRYVLGSTATTGLSPLSLPASFASGFNLLNAGSVSIDLPLEGYWGAFSFDNVFVSHATQGVDGLFWRRDTISSSPTPEQAFCAMVAATEFDDRDYNKLGFEERLNYLVEDLFFGDELTWAPQCHFDFLSWAYGYLIENEGANPVVGDQEQPLLDAIEEFGSYRGGVFTDGFEFPFHFFLFDRAFVISQLSY